MEENVSWAGQEYGWLGQVNAATVRYLHDNKTRTLDQRMLTMGDDSKTLTSHRAGGIEEALDFSSTKLTHDRQQPAGRLVNQTAP
jgi:hypothetical protein